VKLKWGGGVDEVWDMYVNMGWYGGEVSGGEVSITGCARLLVGGN